MEPDPDEEDMEDVRLDDERERHWRMVLGYNDRVLNDEKLIIHDKRWYVYINNKKL